ncbi:tRNA pseudouridine(38-40) synthase TruA [Paenibacillus aurantius]|uniref:tRNA pseudouridine synthase A n=1 Tax=Paenibacillus aurantius TaxID=2918900 RepID=A0AA96LD29_9BACL|nr:tRNA pseudouridine(38-40) synthase TruA [Paenibacillus aurantius]WNQ11769.1 tRNA pseudouridine(38-40) synthase TruA [Paenibacillus aurantius]
MRNLVMVVSYDGSAYSGFQVQPKDTTVQGKLEEAVRVLTGEQVKIHGSGRTDAGVHAREQVIHFHTESQIPVQRWRLAMNARLPSDIVVKSVREAPLDFHSRRSAKRKTYRYTIQRTRYADVFTRHLAFFHPTPLDLEAMRQALVLFEGEHDFSSFCSTRRPDGSHVRTIYETAFDFRPEPDAGDGDAGVIHIYMTGNGFLHNMVRIIIGTLIEVGEGKRPSSDMPAILAAMDRKKAGPTAMAHGLMLWKVEY